VAKESATSLDMLIRWFECRLACPWKKSAGLIRGFDTIIGPFFHERTGNMPCRVDLERGRAFAATLSNKGCAYPKDHATNPQCQPSPDL